MKKISFRVRNFENEQFLTFNIDNDAELDEDTLDYLEEEEPEGIVPVIFEEEEEFDTFSYDITDKIHLCELSAQEINAEMVLLVLRGVAISLLSMAEYRIPLSYLVLNRNYIYIDSDYKVEFVCIPLEDMREEVDLTNFFRNFIASLRFEPSENGDYVAKLLTYVNNRTLFNLRNMLSLIEDLMDDLGIDIPDDNSNEIYGEYQEIIDDEPEESIIEESIIKESIIKESVTEESVVEEPVAEEPVVEEPVVEEPVAEEPVVEEPVAEEPVVEEPVAEEPVAEEPVVEEPVIIEASNKEASDKETSDKEASDKETSDKEASDKETSDKMASDKKEEKQNVKTPSIGVVIEDDLDQFLAEKEKEDMLSCTINKDDNNIKIRSVKVNRASIVQGTKEELEKEHDEEALQKEDTPTESKSEENEITVDDSEKKNSKSKRNSKKADKKASKNDDEKDSKEHDESISENAGDDADKEGGSILSQTIGNAANSIKNAASSAASTVTSTASVPKVNPYLIRVNTDERIMITKQTFKLGKASMGVDYSISGNGAISRVHAIITGKDGEYSIKDNKSTNHTFVDGKSVEEGESVPLTNNCKIVLGDEEFIFKLQ